MLSLTSISLLSFLQLYLFKNEIFDKSPFEIIGISLSLTVCWSVLNIPPLLFFYNTETPENENETDVQIEYEKVIFMDPDTCFFGSVEPILNDLEDNSILLTPHYTTPQANDLRWQKMFLVGLELYKETILKLREQFNNIDINLVSGNHDEMSSFYLYIA